jgi:catechol 2,3-dioxygenase-like lactoylglutathione lyase family enzyme
MAVLGVSIGLKVSDAKRAAAFYAGLLGGEQANWRDQPDRRVWVRLGGISFEIAEVSPWKPLDEATRRQLPVLALQVEPEELDAIVGRLAAAGVPHHGPVLKLAGTSVGVYFADPDGNGLSLSCASGYPIEGLVRRNPDWEPAPYEWTAG